mgnify:CR=1 FL=1
MLTPVTSQMHVARCYLFNNTPLLFSYKILNPSAVDKESDPKKSAGLVLESTGLDPDLYRLGHTKACFPLLLCLVFFP